MLRVQLCLQKHLNQNWSGSSDKLHKSFIIPSKNIAWIVLTKFEISSSGIILLSLEKSNPTLCTQQKIHPYVLFGFKTVTVSTSLKNRLDLLAFDLI